MGREPPRDFSRCLAKPSPSLRDAARTETLRVGVACALRLRQSRRRWRSLSVRRYEARRVADGARAAVLTLSTWREPPERASLYELPLPDLVNCQSSIDSELLLER
jgi:hypothetical protein